MIKNALVGTKMTKHTGVSQNVSNRHSTYGRVKVKTIQLFLREVHRTGQLDMDNWTFS